MNEELDQTIEQARKRNEETERALRDLDREIADRITKEREQRERLSKAIGENFPDKKGKVTLEMEAYFAEKDEQKRFARKQEFAESLGLTMQQLDAYLNLRGESK